VTRRPPSLDGHQDLLGHRLPIRAQLTGKCHHALGGMCAPDAELPRAFAQAALGLPAKGKEGGDPQMATNLR
jgi:hypothetical protein